MRYAGQVYVVLANMPISVKQERLGEREEIGEWENR